MHSKFPVPDATLDLPDADTSGDGPASAPALDTAKLSAGEVKTLHRWFWLRLASGMGAIRDSVAVESHVRDAVIAEAILSADSVAGLTWEALVAELASHATELAPVTSAIIERLRARLAPVATPMELSQVACDILILGTAMGRDQALDRLGKAFTLDGPDDIVGRVAEAIDASEEAVAEALHPMNPLKSRGLVSSRGLVTGIGQAIEPLRAVRHHLYGIRPLDEALVHPFCRPLKVEVDPDVDLTHLSDAAHVLQAFLRTGPSVRVLLHGKPGIGISEFIREVVRRLGWQGYFADLRFISENQFLNDRELGAEGAYAVLRRRPGSVVILDHATQILRSSERDFRNYLDLLEVPTIWVAESLALIDDDIMSRFDHVLEIEAPPRATRIAMLRRSLGPLGVSDALLERIATAEDFVPGEAVRLARSVPVLISQGIAPDAALDALGIKRPRKTQPPEATKARRGLPYRPEWIRANANLSRLADGLARTGSGTLLFSGPPGTGKTEFARYLATRLGRPLLIRGAAELNQQFIGQTEKAMAQAFAEARQQGSILLIDEVDSFLRSRESAVRTWEVSQVNEMLTQLDRFEGIAIFTTNALASLDSAVMRRVDRKVEFDFIAAEHRWEVFAAAAAVLEVPVPAEEGALGRRVRSLTSLAVGDVAVVLRGERLERTFADAEGLYRALTLEIDRRCGVRAPIGFVAV
jgi:hypothetical protein